jgi:hypothetical protein
MVCIYAHFTGLLQVKQFIITTILGYVKSFKIAQIMDAHL